ncbi:MAG: hypothetical protein M3177_04485 [Pseudomonadota bacterium]|nr:hypothetical protein [Pseudomonadota bacterium]
MQSRLWPLLIVTACAPAADDTRFGDDITIAERPARSPYTGPEYFPPELGQPTLRCSFDTDDRLHPILSELERDWYSRQLAAADEPSLYLLSREALRPSGSATLRFTWLRSFHPPVVIRIETSGPDLHRLVAKQLSGAGGYDPGEVSKTVERPLTPAEAERLRTVLERARLFEIPPDPCPGGCDGSEWIFEAVEGRRYRFTSLWSPDTGPGHELGRFLMALTGWEFDEVY